MSDNIVVTFKPGTDSWDAGSATQKASLSSPSLRIDGVAVKVTRKGDTVPTLRFSRAQVAAIAAMSDKAIASGKLTIPRAAGRGRPRKAALTGSAFRALVAPVAPVRKARAPRTVKAPATAPDATPSA